jgi:hypothetical protein
MAPIIALGAEITSAPSGSKRPMAILVFEVEIGLKNRGHPPVLASLMGVLDFSRSRSPRRTEALEYLYVIQSANLSGLAIYSKSKLVKEAGEEVYYFLISSKKAI